VCELVRCMDLCVWYGMYGYDMTHFLNVSTRGLEYACDILYVCCIVFKSIFYER